MNNPKHITRLNAALFVIALLISIITFSPVGDMLIQRAYAIHAAVFGDGNINFVTRFVTASPSHQIGDSIIYDSGTNVGIGTVVPERKLQVNNEIKLGPGSVAVNDTRGIYWHTASNYAIHRTPGLWTSPNYQQLKIQFATGIILRPGEDGHTNGIGYGRSYVEIDRGKGLMVTSGNIGIGTAAPVSKLHTFETKTDTVNALVQTGYNQLSAAPSAASLTDFAAQRNYVYSGNANSIDRMFGAYNEARYDDVGTASILYGSNNYALVNNPSAIVTTVYGAQNYALNNLNGTVTNLYGATNIAINNAAGVVNNIRGTQSYARNDDMVSANNAYGLVSFVQQHGAIGSIDNAYGVYAYTVLSGGATDAQITNAYGVFIANIRGTNTYGVYQQNSTDKNYFAGNVGIGTVAPRVKLDVAGGGADIASGVGTGNAIIELGQGRTASGYAIIDFHGDTTYSDYGLRIIRNNGGANTSSEIRHQGTGGLNLTTLGSAPLIFRTTNVERMRITPSGNVGIGTAAPGAKLEVSTGGLGLYLNQPTAADIYMRYHVPGVRWWTVGPKANGDFWFSNASNLSTPGPLTLTSGGNVGIGTAAPRGTLEVNGSVVLTPLAADPVSPVDGMMWMRI